MVKVGGRVGRTRKPFMEKNTNIFIQFSNPEIKEMLDALKIPYEEPELLWETETINKLKVEIKKILVENIKKCKK